MSTALPLLAWIVPPAPTDCEGLMTGCRRVGVERGTVVDAMLSVPNFVVPVLFIKETPGLVSVSRHLTVANERSHEFSMLMPRAYV